MEESDDQTTAAARARTPQPQPLVTQPYLVPLRRSCRVKSDPEKYKFRMHDTRSVNIADNAHATLLLMSNHRPDVFMVLET